MRFNAERSTTERQRARRRRHVRLLPLLCWALAVAPVCPTADAQDDPLEQQRAASDREVSDRGKLLVVQVQGEITGTLAATTRAEVESWLKKEPTIEFVVFELDTPGGEVVASAELARFVADLKGVRTVAWIPPHKFALSGGTMIALAAQDLVMGFDSRIGAVAPVQQTSPWSFEELGEKQQSYVRSILTGHAMARGYPTILTDAMVSKNHPDILAVDFAVSGIGTPAEKTRTTFLTRSDYDNLTAEKRTTLQRGELRTVLREGKILTIETTLAREYGFARAIADDIYGLRLELKIDIADANVINASSGPLKATSPGAQRLVNFCNQPFVRFVLIAGGLLGIFVEFQMFGAAIPGVIGLLCFSLFFGTSLFPISGTVAPSATVWEVLVFPLGLALIAVEFFLPGVAVFALSGAALCLTSMVLAMVPPEGGAAGQMTIQEAITVLIYGFGVGCIGFLLLLRWLPRSRLLARRGMVSHAAIEGVPTADSSLEAQARDSWRLGKEGVAVTPLHPAGKVRLDDGTLLDVVTSGDYVVRGGRVRVVDIGSGRTIVAPLATSGDEAHTETQAP